MSQMERMVDRNVPPTTTSRLVAMAMMVYSLPRPVRHTDAILVLPGQGEDWRLANAVRLWNKSRGRYFLVAGSYPGERTWFQPTLATLKAAPFNLRRTNGVIIEPRADHTGEQAQALVRRVRELGITSLTLTVSPYRLLRAYCGIVKALLDSNIWIPVIPAPTEVSPMVIVPETGLTGWEMVAGEVERITKYQAEGWVLAAEQLCDYLDWLWMQPIFQHA